MADGALDVHRGAPGVDDPCLDLDQVPGRDAVAEGDVPDVGGHAVVAAPARGHGVRGLVDPFQDPAPVDDVLTVEEDVGGCGEEPQGLHGGSGGHRTAPFCRVAAHYRSSPGLAGPDRADAGNEPVVRRGRTAGASPRAERSPPGPVAAGQPRQAARSRRRDRWMPVIPTR
ncbi:hypothetical protein SDC9_81163 [bioreactor metagenome]|uniref:Uncharacterized protein n=1 Tax=bioreactor metagenome TaxID=1076179 RepID=A0A644Z1S3_9ZZZZ